MNRIYIWKSRHRKAMWDKDRKVLSSIGIFDYEAAKAKAIIPKTPDEELFVRTLQAQAKLELAKERDETRAALDKETKAMAARDARSAAATPLSENEREELETLRAENRVLRLELEAADEAARQQKSSPAPVISAHETPEVAREMSSEEKAALHSRIEISDGLRQNRIVVGMTTAQVEGILRNRPGLPLERKDRSESRGTDGKIVVSESWWIKTNGHVGLLSFTDGKLDYMGN
ncbi:MAG TPA: hypothetical protein VFC78_12010 [Tepidisphaeraceae bacterium]|nr:hypothetical protein [Tepidisphaeraceae bacterium]